ncbi:MAG: phosphotransferase family protein [Acidimicrobiia bacterium]|nr:phosphotransferase family protein [Acidimicrobiia bacterium]MCL4292166.1 phosphotransferase family protein [Acidimicrobiia bacterium]
MTPPGPPEAPPPDAPIARSTRSHDDLARRLEAWLRDGPPGLEGAAVTGLSVPETGGMSSETLLFDLTWTEEGRTRRARRVARVEPDPGDMPVFPRYDLAAQARVMRLVAEHTAVPVPAVVAVEEDPAVLGTPFIVMERVDGRVPPDVMPYTMEGWLRDSPEADRRALQDATVRVLAALHAVGPATCDLSFLTYDAPGDTPLRRHVEHWRRYYDWVRADIRFPLLDAAFARLDDTWPAEEGPAALSWGDARIGNVIYRDHEPAAVLDWEMAGVAPPGVDLGWFVVLHRFFDGIAEMLGVEGLPTFARRADVIDAYARAGGQVPGDPDFFELYAALRHGIVMARVHARRVHFGEAAWPDDPDDAIMHRPMLESMLDGS